MLKYTWKEICVSKSIGLACSWKEIYVSNLKQVFTETRLEDVVLSKTQPCKYFLYMDRGNPSQEWRVNYANSNILWHFLTTVTRLYKINLFILIFKENPLKQNFVIFVSCYQRFFTTGQSECCVRSRTQGIKHSKPLVQVFASNPRELERWRKPKHKCLLVIY